MPDLIRQGSIICRGRKSTWSEVGDESSEARCDSSDARKDISDTHVQSSDTHIETVE